MYGPGTDPILPMVSTIGPWGTMRLFPALTGAASSGALPTTIAYQPVLVPCTCIVRRLWWANGSTVSASYNIYVGVYSDNGYRPGSLLVETGATAQGTASQVQFVDVTDTTLSPGLYWLAIKTSDGAATGFRIALSSGVDALYGFQEAGSSLPATATPAESAIGQVYVFGFATTASP